MRWHNFALSALLWLFIIAIGTAAWGRSVITNAGMGTTPPAACANLILTATPDIVVTDAPSEVIPC